MISYRDLGSSTLILSGTSPNRSDTLFPKEVYPLPESWVAALGNLVFYKAHERVRFVAMNSFMLRKKWSVFDMWC